MFCFILLQHLCYFILSLQLSRDFYQFPITADLYNSGRRQLRSADANVLSVPRTRS